VNQCVAKGHEAEEKYEFVHDASGLIDVCSAAEQWREISDAES
jgi:hypothetical protein